MSSEPFDVGLLSPVAADVADLSDAAVLDALVTVEVALARAWHDVGAAPAAAVATISDALGWNGSGELATGHGISTGDLAKAGVAGGNPVIPLVAVLKARVGTDAAAWIHRGPISQDILDSALMLTAKLAAKRIADDLQHVAHGLARLAIAHADDVALSRTLTQPAVPTTLGARIAVWSRAVTASWFELQRLAGGLPTQLAGAGGTFASFVQIGGDAAEGLPTAFAEQLDLASTWGPWHTDRYLITQFADAVVRAVDALGKLATDVATSSRAEIDEFREGTGGGSSAMPQKQNPVASVLIRSAALRAPNLAATLHVASALAVDERPDGSWHAEWPTLRELLRIARGAAHHACALVDGLHVNAAVAAEHLATHPEVISERLSIVLPDLLGADAAKAALQRVGAGEDPVAVLTDVGADPTLADPRGYLGWAKTFAESVITGDEA